jgi:glucose/arabinose dehydrogenase
VDTNSELVLINQFDPHLWHNGGGMFFGTDGFLYLINGDGGGADDNYNNTQKINSGLFSGVVRIDVDQNPTRSHPIRRHPVDNTTIPSGWVGSTSGNYYVPNDNPWVNPDGSVLEEFWAIGVRSPHRMTFDPISGQIWNGDVGQNDREEVNLIVKGGNYQWAYREGIIAGPKAMPNPLIGIDKPPVMIIHTRTAIAA